MNPSGDLFLCDELRSGRPYALNDEEFQAAIEKDSSLTRGELAKQFNVTNETVILHLHLLGKKYRLSKWVPRMLLEAHKKQQMITCISLLSFHRNTSIFNQELTNDKM
ncbi:histone-lysine N-methyltransferase SETMAR [Nephila pilipes]|uniref:Histone-lysine N-methyltransferase SETMAR n=1 Tax=Nephila pilipes TaxID=299642 RepID=A0A8X6PH91_NEPPI|nr:histone-lysine N-methyltransferase SETMAR [Nephila pilipes]